MKRHAPLPLPRDSAQFSPHYPKHFPRHCYFSAHPDPQADRLPAALLGVADAGGCPPGCLYQSNKTTCGGARHGGSEEASAEAPFSSRGLRISLDHHSVLDAGESLPRERSECFGHDPDRPAAGPASLDIDTKYACQALRLYALWVQVIDARRSAGVCSSEAHCQGRRLPLPLPPCVTRARCRLLLCSD